MKLSGKTYRDLSIIEIGAEQVLVIACDSAGGIGSKVGDSIRVPAEIVGKFTTRVALMEVLAVNARPLSIVNTLSVEYNPTGKGIIHGIKEEIKKLGLDDTILVNGSTEENVSTSETGIGVTVIGLAKKGDLIFASSQNDDLLVAIGWPSVGEEVLEKKELVADLDDINKLMEIKGVHEIIPVGSKGIAYEADLLAQMSGLDCNYLRGLKIDLHKSAGPATTILASVAADALKAVQDRISKPLNLIGKLLS